MKEELFFNSKCVTSRKTRCTNDDRKQVTETYEAQTSNKEATIRGRTRTLHPQPSQQDLEKQPRNLNSADQPLLPASPPPSNGRGLRAQRGASTGVGGGTSSASWGCSHAAGGARASQVTSSRPSLLSGPQGPTRSYGVWPARTPAGAAGPSERGKVGGLRPRSSGAAGVSATADPVRPPAPGSRSRGPRRPRRGGRGEDEGPRECEAPRNRPPGQRVQTPGRGRPRRRTRPGTRG